MINVAHDTKMMYGRTLDGQSFMFGGNPTKNTKNTRGKRGKHKGKHSTNNNIVTHALDPRNTKEYKILIQQRTIHRVTGSSP